MMNASQRYCYAALAIALLSLAACSDSADETRRDHPLASTFAAHGGYARWAEFGAMRYTMTGFPLTPAVAAANRSTVDLKTRRNRIESDAFMVGWDGERAWSSPTADATGLPARFFNLGSYYFIGMPFVFGDAGAKVTREADATHEGKSYETYRVTYPGAVGHSPDDDYVVYIDPSSRKLRLIHHSVTETKVARVTWVFDEWQTVEGILVPARLTFYPGTAGAGRPAEGAASFTVTAASFDRAAPPASLYTPPAGAVVL